MAAVDEGEEENECDEGNKRGNEAGEIIRWVELAMASSSMSSSMIGLFGNERGRHTEDISNRRWIGRAVALRESAFPQNVLKHVER